MHALSRLLAALTLVTLVGCGTAAPGPTAGRPAPARAHSAESAPLTMHQAFALAAAHAKTTYGDDFRPFMAFADDAFDENGQALPTTWRFNMVGHLRGQSGYAWMKLQIRPDGTPYVDPKRGGPFPDRNGHHQLPVLDLEKAIAVEKGLAIVANSRIGRKFPRAGKVSWEVRPVDRLKVTAMTYRWTSRRNQSGWMCDVLIDPLSGELVEENAYQAAGRTAARR